MPRAARRIAGHAVAARRCPRAAIASPCRRRRDRATRTAGTSCWSIMRSRSRSRKRRLSQPAREPARARRRRQRRALIGDPSRAQLDARARRARAARSRSSALVERRVARVDADPEADRCVAARSPRHVEDGLPELGQARQIRRSDERRRAPAHRTPISNVIGTNAGGEMSGPAADVERVVEGVAPPLEQVRRAPRRRSANGKHDPVSGERCSAERLLERPGRDRA